MYKKERKTKRIIASLILIIYILLGSLNTYIYAANSKNNNKNDEVLNPSVKIDVIDNDGSQIVSEKLSKDIVENNIVGLNIPSSYEYGKSDNTKINKAYQEQLGLCWAFTAMNIMESSAQKQLNIAPNNLLSRRHIDYISSNTIKNNPYMTGRTLAFGSDLQMGMAYGANGAGLVYDKDFPMHYDNKSLTLNDINLQKAPYNVKDVRVFNRIIKKYSGGKIKYYADDDGKKELTTREINNIRNEVKEHLINKGAVGSKIYVSNGKDFYSGTGRHLFIHPSNNQNVNHAITIVGWDDNVSKDKFIDPVNGRKPENNGAWIVEDTRGGVPRGLKRDDTRYYVSYDSLNIESTYWTGAKSMKRTNQSLENIYTDYAWGTNSGLVITQPSISENNSVEILNVFEKDSDTLEKIKGIGIYTSDPIRVKVGIIPVLKYSGKLIDAINNDKTEYLNKTFNINNDGYNYLDLSDLGNTVIRAKKGEKFAIKVKYLSDTEVMKISLDAKRTGNATKEIQIINAQKQFKPDTSYMNITTGNEFSNIASGFKALYGTEGSESNIGGLSREKRAPMNVYSDYMEQLNVSFDLDGGSGNIPSEKVGKYQKATKPKDPTKAGHIFKGWYPNINEPITRDTIFKAIWEKVSDGNTYFEVNYDLNGGNIDGKASVETVKVKKGEKAPILKTPQKAGYVFMGWLPSIYEPITRNTTFKAMWKQDLKDKIAIAFDLDGGNIDGETLIPIKYIDKGSNKKINIKDPEKSGYTFIGWSPDINQPITRDITYKALWKKNSSVNNKHNVTFDLQGGWGAHVPMEVEDGTVLENIPNPNKSKYKFSHWEPDITQPIKKDTEFKAIWIPNEVGFTLKYNIDGRSDLIKVIPYGQKPTDHLDDRQINPTKPGYKFIGWEPSIDEPLTNEHNIFEAKWQKESKKEATISFYTGEGKLYKQKSININDKVTRDFLNEIGTPEKEDYEFIGWDYDFSKPITEDINVFAKWKEKLNENIQIEFDLNGGYFFLNSTLTYTKKRDESFSDWLDKMLENKGQNKDKKVPIKRGYTFVCWVDANTNIRYPNTKELKNKYLLKAVWTDVEQNKSIDELINDAYKKVDAEDKDSKIEDINKFIQNNTKPNKPNPVPSPQENNNRADIKPTQDINNNSNRTKPREEGKSTSSRWTFYEPMGRDKKGETTDIQIKDSNKEKRKDELNKKPESDNPYTGLKSNIKMYIVLTLIIVIATYYGFKIIDINKRAKMKNIY